MLLGSPLRRRISTQFRDSSFDYPKHGKNQ